MMTKQGSNSWTVRSTVLFDFELHTATGSSSHATTSVHHERSADGSIDITMRHQRDIRLLRRHIFKSHNHNPTSSARYGSSKTREPYILPRLVIDLDANDNQFVRQATEEDYAVKPKPPRRQPYEAKQLALHRRSIPHAFHANTIAAPDLLAYALLGNPNASPTSDNLVLRTQFKYLKLQPF